MTEEKNEQEAKAETEAAELVRKEDRLRQKTKRIANMQSYEQILKFREIFKNATFLTTNKNIPVLTLSEFLEHDAQEYFEGLQGLIVIFSSLEKCDMS